MAHNIFLSKIILWNPIQIKQPYFMLQSSGHPSTCEVNLNDMSNYMNLPEQQPKPQRNKTVQNSSKILFYTMCSLW